MRLKNFKDSIFSLKHLNNKALLSIWVILGLLALTTSLGFQNCAQTPTPGNVATLSSIAAIIHTGKETTCSNCHETGKSGRPTSTAGFVGLNVNTPFNYTTHAKGVDCISCHDMTQIARTKADWGNGFFNHNSTLTSCNSCHTSQEPTNSVTDLALTGGFDHTILGAQDCFACHASSLNTPFSSMSNWSGAVGAANGLLYTIASDVNLTGQSSQLPNFSNTIISSLTNLPQSLHMNMNHQSPQIMPQVISNCVSCHAGGVYTSGVFHASYRAAGIPQPTSCSECHNASSSPVGFVGPATPAPVSPRSPTSNEMRHDAVVWSKNGAGVYTSSAARLIGNDCVVCHASPVAAPAVNTNGWNGGTYHAALTTAKLSQPSSCLDCHANSRPIGFSTGTLTRFDHTTHVNGMGDCLSCHASKTSWTAGIFHQVGMTAPTTCNSCHSSQKPNGTVTIGSAGGSFNFVAYNAAVLPFDTSSIQNPTGYHGGTRDCRVCHAPTLYNLMSNWSGGNFNHVAAKAAGTLTSCQDCHISQRPATIAPSALNGLASSFNHATDGLGDCIACHSATITRAVYANYQTANPGTYGDTDWRGGTAYSITGLMGPDPTQALTTVSAVQLNYANLATFQVASTTTVTETLSDQIIHGSTQIPAALWVGATVGNPGGLDTAKCNTCHSNLPTKFAGSSFHATSVPAGPQAAANLSACTECHINTVPQNIVGPVLSPMDHDAVLSSGSVAASDCLVCHVKASAGTSFSGASFHSKIGAASASTCTTCHYVTAPAGAFAFTGRSTFTPGFKHSSAFAPGDCNSCHTLTNTQINTLVTANGKVSTNFASAFYHKNITPASITSCMDCHTKTTIVNSTVSTTDTQHMNHNSSSVGNDCYLCHSNDLVAGVTPTAFAKTNLLHAGTNTSLTKAGATISSCQECHGLTNGGGAVAGTNNDLPGGLVNTDVASTYPAGNTTLLDQFDHRVAGATGKDCNICHTNIGATGPKWKAAKFHAKVTVTGPSTACETCHANLLPPGVANGENHATAHTACGTCHTDPAGTGTIGSSTSPANWKGAAGGIPVNVTFLPPTNSGWASLTLPHPVPATGVTCAQCHGATIGPVIIGWDHKNMPTAPGGVNYCMYCHLTGQKIVATAGLTAFQTKPQNHHADKVPGGIIATDTCEYCHTPGSYTHPTTYPNPWNSGTTGSVRGP